MLTRQQAMNQLTAGDHPEFPLGTETIRGVPHTIFREQPTNLAQFFQSRATKFATRQCLAYLDQQLTYSDVYSQASALASRLVNHYGIQKGDRIALGLRNCPEWIVAFMAITSIGGIAVSLNAWWVGEELHQALLDVQPSLLIVDHQRWLRLSNRIDPVQLPVIGVDVRGTPEQEPWPRSVADFDQVVAQGRGQPMPSVDVQPDDDATILFTSGSTGFPKGAVGTHRGILSTLASWWFWLRVRQLTGALPVPPPGKLQAMLMPLPLFHVSGSHVGFLASYMAGRKLVLMYKWDPEEALKLIETHRITEFYGVPTLALELLQHRTFHHHDTSSLAVVGVGGAPMPARLVDEMHSRLPGVYFKLGWGMTETSAGGLNIGLEDIVHRPDSCGLWTPVCDVRIVDDKGQEVRSGQPGELLIKSPMTMRCYWNDSTATQAAIHDGWLRTGDIAKIDDQNFVYIVDRKKDVVIRGGENVYCAEVERVISMHQDVCETAVFGLPDDHWGEKVAAVIMPRPGKSICPDELRTHLRCHLATFKHPAVLAFQSERLPRGPTAKIHKRLLRQEMMKNLNTALPKAQ